MRLLIVDDSMIIRNRIKRALTDLSLEVVGVARDGREAVDLTRSVQPQIVTMDLTMPRMGGAECISAILKIDPNLLILVVSALQDKLTAIRALKLGAQGFLCKPFSAEELTGALSTLIKGAQR